MTFIYWLCIIVFVLMIGIGLKDGLRTFFQLWGSNGFTFALLTGLLLMLFIAPSLVKQFAPEYYNYSVGALILYIIGLLIFKRRGTKGD